MLTGTLRSCCYAPDGLRQSGSESFSPSANEADRRPHAVVIGSGFGGLAAAIRLGARGYRVTVLERLDAPGGRAYVFKQDGFTFDAGPTILTVPHVFEDLWTLAGRDFHQEITLNPIDPFYRIRFSEDRYFDAYHSEADLREEVRRFSPGDVEGFDRFMEESKRICDFAFLELGHKSMHSAAFMASVMPRLLKHQAIASLHTLVSRYVKDPDLRAVMSFHPLLIGGNPFTVTAIYALIKNLQHRWGVHFPTGGTGALVTGMVDVIEGLGGTVRCNADVEQILVENRRAVGVELADGTKIAADVVVSNADAAWTYKRLLSRTKRRWWPDWRVNISRYSMSLFVWYFGTNRRFEDVPHHMILMGPRYEGLLKDIFKSKVLADDFSLYLHRPTATDPSLAPAGCDAFYALSPVPHLDSSDDWGEIKETYRQKIEASLNETVLPGLSGSVVSSHVITPQYFRDNLKSEKGAAFSFEPVLTQSAWFRPHNRSEDIDRLYLVGAGTHPGAGMPGVVSSARVLDEVVPDAAALVE